MSVFDTQDAIRPWERLDLEKWEHFGAAPPGRQFSEACDKLRPHYSSEWVCDTCQRKVRVKVGGTEK